MSGRFTRCVLAACMLVTTSTPVTAADPASTSPRSDADSFRFNFSMNLEIDSQSTFLVATGGVFVVPLSEKCTVAASVAKTLLRQRRIAVGDRVWTDVGDGYQEDADDTLQFSNLCASGPEFWRGFVPPTDLSTASVREAATIKGIDAERLEFTRLADVFPELGDLIGIPSEATVDELFIWISKTPTPMLVAFDLGFSGATQDVCNDFLGGGPDQDASGKCTLTISLRLSRLNDKALNVKAPRVADQENRSR